ncbi:MAG: hypothetical protein QOD92_1392 [Acidimicrobiaceae bacterium]|jgi:hypothetical protein
MTAPAPSFAHVAHMTDEHGMFEHADHSTPRPEHGYCTDDMARLLVVACREPNPNSLVLGLAKTALRFLVEAQGVGGDACSRMNRRGRWQGRRTVEDCWGRSLWGFGTAAARGPHDWMRQDALTRFERGAKRRSPWPKSMAFAALGADEVLAAHPEHRGALGLLADAVEVLGRPARDRSWPWPDPRLSYANAVLPEAMIAAGAALDRDDLVADGLELLGWLLDHETHSGHLSVTPVGGSAPGDTRPAFDQQPIEVAALADACARAWRVTEDPRWATGVAAAVAWFQGDNDAQAPMWDDDTGGGYDGLRSDGPNLNEGAESTLALISTLQHARHLHAVPA